MRLTIAIVCLSAFAAHVGSVGATTITTGDGNGADTYINGGNLVDTNFGNSTSMTIKGYSTNTQYTRKNYLRFDLSAISGQTVTEATLYLTTDNNDSGGGDPTPNTFDVQVFGLTNETLDNWVEGNGGSDGLPAGEVTWNNAPANATTNNDFTADATLLGQFNVPAVDDPDLVSFSDPDLITFLNNDTNGVVTLLLRRTEAGSKNLSFASKEHATHAPPTLEMTAVPEPTTLALAAVGLLGLRRRRRA